MEQLFAYGTLRDPEIRELLLGHACHVAPARLPDWGLFAARSGYLFIKPLPRSHVDGLLLDLQPGDLSHLDRWEAVPYYHRERLVVWQGKHAGDVWAYTRRQANGEPVHDDRLANIPRHLILAQLRQV